MYVFLFLRNSICTMITMGSKNSLLKFQPSTKLHTLFPHRRPTGINISHSLQMRVLLENTTFSLRKIIRIAGISRIAVIVRGRALYEEIWYISFLDQLMNSKTTIHLQCQKRLWPHCHTIDATSKWVEINSERTFLFYCKFQFKNCLWILVKTHKQKKIWMWIEHLLLDQ